MKIVSIGGASALGLALAGLLGGAPARADVSAATAEQAQRKADHYDNLAEHYRGFGGMAWKAGLVEQAERQAAHYQRIADGESQAPATTKTNTSKGASMTPECEATKPGTQEFCKK